MEEYFDSFNRVDIALDTAPYSGGTTTCDALWMGVPVVTLAGQSSVSRSGVSLLSNAGLSDLVAASPEEYVAIALALARDQARIEELRHTLRNRTRCSALMDEAGFVRDIEAAYRHMWQMWCHSATPQ